MPPVEAMACGCPVICSPNGSLGEVVGDAAAIVDPQDVHSIANQLRTLAGDANLRESFRHAGLIRAKQFDWNRTAAETLSIYDRVAQNEEKILSMRPL
jgi:glycosyltransferase involved in cell wall biosynthesis